MAKHECVCCIWPEVSGNNHHGFILLHIGNRQPNALVYFSALPSTPASTC
jgi:hypothetical protein